jgi:hypothetical protein
MQIRLLLYYNMFDDNPILIDTNSRRNKRQKINCVLCKVQLECFNPEENRYKCPRCKNTYQLGYGEIIPQEDILESSHEVEEEESAGLLVKENEFETEEDTSSKSDIPIPKYMKDSETSKVTYFRED